MTHNNIGSYKMQTTKTMYLSSALLQPTQQVNGNARNKVDNLDSRLWHSSDGRTKCFSREYRDENKTTAKLSERLKVLLENGSITEKTDDPYAFQDVEQPPDVLSSTFNNVATIKRCTSAQTTSSTQLPPSISVGSSDVVKTKPVNSSLKNASLMPVPVYMASNPNAALTCRLNVNQANVLPRHHTEAAKVASCLLKPSKTTQLLAAPTKVALSTNLFAKTVSPKLGTTAPQCKPQNFGKSQMSKLAIAKIEKTLEVQKKTIVKGVLPISLNKTASISKFLPKPRKSTPIRSTSLDSNLISKVDKNKTKLITGKCLLEESLLGVRSPAHWNNLPGAADTKDSVSVIKINSRHESLERIWALRNKFRSIKGRHEEFGLLFGCDKIESQETEIDNCLFQKYWFSLCTDYDSFAGHNRKREAKLAHIKTELRHKLKQKQWRLQDDYRDQMAELIIGAARRLPNLTAFLVGIDSDSSRNFDRDDRHRWKSDCMFSDSKTSQPCRDRALPNAPFCAQHIHLHASQHLFGPCTSLTQFDGSPCNSPAVGKGNTGILCVEHQRLQPQAQLKPIADKVAGKRSRSAVGASRSGRSRKRKRQLKDRKDQRDYTEDTGYCAFNPSENTSNSLSDHVYVVSKNGMDATLDSHIEGGEEALAIASAELPLDSVELATLANQASRLLEEQDFSAVLNNIPADAFNDLFSDGREKCEPTLQETEELERALEAVNNDVKSLEKLSETQDLFDMLDEQSIAQTLAALPDVPALYQNGFAGLDQTICDALPNQLIISPHADILQS